MTLIKEQVQLYVRHDPPINTAKAYFNDHGSTHIGAVLSNARRISSRAYIATFPIEEQAILCGAIWLHDVGLFVHPVGINEVDLRANHAQYAADFIDDLQRRNSNAISPQLAQLLGQVCLAHRRDFDLSGMTASPRIPECEVWIRGDLIAGFLRVCDAADVGQGRTPVALLERWGDALPESSRSHWRGHGLIHSSTLSEQTGEVLFHVIDDADLRDANLRELYVAATDDLDSTRQVLVRHGLRPWSVRYEWRGDYYTPGSMYAQETK